MVNALFEKGREGFLDGSIDWDTDTISAALLDLGTTDAAIKAITGATNASPIVITSNSHGFAVGDTVVIDGVGGNTAANNVWVISAQDTNTFTLTSSTGNGSYTSGGYAVNLGPSSVSDNYDDFSAALVGAKVNLANKTKTAGVADADDVTFTAVSGNTVEASIIFKDTGTESTSRLIAFLDGKHKVTCAVQANSSATTIYVEPLTAGIASGQTLVFSNGASATLSGAASAGDRSLSVNSLAANVTAGSWASANASGSGLPVTPNGGNISLAFSSGANKIFKL
jgi:hypothetical protein